MLPIAGIQKVTLVDYPKHISATLFLQGCNLRCGFCHNSALMPLPKQDKKYRDKWKETIIYLSYRKKYLKGVCITGGEPTIHKNLPNALQEIKNLGYKIKLDTNGTNPDMLEILFEQRLVDYVAMDIKTTFDKYVDLGYNGSIENLKKSISLIKNCAPNYEFRTTVVPELVNEDNIFEIIEPIKGAYLYVLQLYNPKYAYNSKRFSKRYTIGEIESLAKKIEKFFGKVVVRT